ncbi:L-asparaginase/GlutRNAGln amidotransferase subunit D [Halovivax ruber XH-70]|uniref:L-asparaginase n=1 Tax=Halovivax ruber (strain DSM 18193 / JCM 13892 / XH-70) TaxID=797302 RepID=L0IA67_HALRX|nr:asparaginase [Halovivax ruber]AGB15141.1 L-asparaginase/GlutRNAGln amidotransferase subunit D [Halovivax ruber XH-70]
MDVTILATGGTIASTAGAGETGANPTKRGRELVDAVPPLSDLADLTVEDVVQVPSYELDAESLEAIGERVRELDADPSVDAVVVTHGTDTMEETAYYTDVTVQPETPVLFTGAQRRPDEVSADGPSNLLTAVRTARAFRDRPAGGTVVAFDETVHSARAVRKVHTSRMGAFRSPGRGPVAVVDRNGVAIRRQPQSETHPISATSLSATVVAITSTSCADDTLVRAAIDRGVDGIVVEGTGLGNVTAPIGDAVATAIEAGIPVVVTSRCLAGRTSPVYGGDGGGQTLRDHGAILAGDLSAGKARLRLSLAIAAAADRGIDEPTATREWLREAFVGPREEPSPDDNSLSAETGET